jgi:hypothetical protein
MKSVNEWLHERGFDEVVLPPRGGFNFASSRRRHSGSPTSAEAVRLNEDDAEERGVMELATNTQKVSSVDAEAEKPTMPK